jgi:hypothetical protein
MPLEPLFQSFRAAIEVRFAAASADAGQHPNALELRIEEEPHDPRSRGRAEFFVLDPAGPVRITWNGIASLWAFCQGAARVSRRMFNSKREGKERLTVDDDPELRRGIDSLELARRFCTQDIPAAAPHTHRMETPLLKRPSPRRKAAPLI